MSICFVTAHGGTALCFSNSRINQLIKKKNVYIETPCKSTELKKNEKKNENCTILIPKRNSYCCRKSSARGPRFKVSSEGLSAEIDIPQRSPIQVQTKADGASSKVSGSYGMPIATDMPIATELGTLAYEYWNTLHLQN